MATTKHSAAAGAQLDRYFASFEGFCKDCANRMLLADMLFKQHKAEAAAERSEVFTTAFFGYLKDTIAKSKDENEADYKKRAEREAAELYKQFTNKMLRDTPLFKYMSSAADLYSLLCSQLVGYFDTCAVGAQPFAEVEQRKAYEAAQKQGKKIAQRVKFWQFANVAKIAVNVDNLEAEDLAEWEKLAAERTAAGVAKAYKNTYIDKDGCAVEIYYKLADREAVESFCEVGASKYAEVREQRKQRYSGSAAESAKIWQGTKQATENSSADLGDLYTLKAADKVGYTVILPAIRKFASAAAEAERKQQQAAEREARKQQKQQQQKQQSFDKLHTFAENLQKLAAKMSEAKAVTKNAIAQREKIESAAAKQFAELEAFAVESKQQSKFQKLQAAYKLAAEAVAAAYTAAEQRAAQSKQQKQNAAREQPEAEQPQTISAAQSKRAAI